MDWHNPPQRLLAFHKGRDPTYGFASLSFFALSLPDAMTSVPPSTRSAVADGVSQSEAPVPASCTRSWTMRHVRIGPPPEPHCAWWYAYPYCFFRLAIDQQRHLAFQHVARARLDLWAAFW